MSRCLPARMAVVLDDTGLELDQEHGGEAFSYAVFLARILQLVARVLGA